MGLNVDRNNNVAIGTDRTYESSTVNALDVRHGKAIFNAVGVGTTSPRSAVDFSDVGRAHADVVQTVAGRGYMYPPKGSNTDRGNFTGLTAGALFYNTSTNKLQVYNGSAWQDCN